MRIMVLSGYTWLLCFLLCVLCKDSFWLPEEKIKVERMVAGWLRDCPWLRKKYVLVQNDISVFTRWTHFLLDRPVSRAS